MSLTMIPRKGKSPNYNISGWDMCAFVNMLAGSPVYFGTIAAMMDDDDFKNYPYIPETATKAQAASWGAKIRMEFLDYEDFMAKQKLKALKRLCMGITKRRTKNDFKEFIDEWATFLEKCEGYKIV